MPTEFPEADATEQDCITDDRPTSSATTGCSSSVTCCAATSSGRCRSRPRRSSAARSKIEAQGARLLLQEARADRRAGAVPRRVRHRQDDRRQGAAGPPVHPAQRGKAPGPQLHPDVGLDGLQAGGAGAAIPWHRDAGTGNGADRCHIFNVDFYLDGIRHDELPLGHSRLERWTAEQAAETVKRLNARRRRSRPTRNACRS